MQTGIAKKETEIQVPDADGITRSSPIISDGFTHESLHHETEQALLSFAGKGNTNTVVISVGTSIAPMRNVGRSAKQALQVRPVRGYWHRHARPWALSMASPFPR